MSPSKYSYNEDKKESENVIGGHMFQENSYFVLVETTI